MARYDRSAQGAYAAQRLISAHGSVPVPATVANRKDETVHVSDGPQAGSLEDRRGLRQSIRANEIDDALGARVGKHPTHHRHRREKRSHVSGGHEIAQHPDYQGPTGEREGMREARDAQTDVAVTAKSEPCRPAVADRGGISAIEEVGELGMSVRDHKLLELPLVLEGIHTENGQRRRAAHTAAHGSLRSYRAS